MPRIFTQPPFPELLLVGNGHQTDSSAKHDLCLVHFCIFEHELEEEKVNLPENPEVAALESEQKRSSYSQLKTSLLPLLKPSPRASFVLLITGKSHVTINETSERLFAGGI